MLDGIFWKGTAGKVRKRQEKKERDNKKEGGGWNKNSTDKMRF